MDKVIAGQKTVVYNGLTGDQETFNVNKENKILDKGQYFAEMYYVPYYHYSIDLADETIELDNGDLIYQFEILEDIFPEIIGRKYIYLYIDSLGFVYGLVTEKESNEILLSDFQKGL